MRLEVFCQVVVDPIGHEARLSIDRCGQLTLQGIVRDDDLFDLSVFEELLELTVWDRRDCLLRVPHL